MLKFLFVLMVLSASNALANPYFRPLDVKDVHRVAGAFIDPRDLDNTSAGGAVALVTHSTTDGCLLPSVVCEDWSPLMAGGSVHGGRFEFDMGPAWNLTPFAKIGLLHLLNTLTPSETLSGVKSILGSQPITGPDISFSFGPAIGVAPVVNGVIIPLSQWHGKFLIFAGSAIRW